MISQHLKGILITTLGVVILSPDALLIRLLNADTVTVVFWRGLVFSIGITLLMLLMYRGLTFQQFKKIGKPGLLIGLIFGFSSLFFTASVQNTSIGNTLVIISTSPIFAAIFSWYYLGEKVHKRTMIAIVIVLLAIVMIMSNSFFNDGVGDGFKTGGSTGGFWGDVSALGTAVLMAISFTLTRKYKETNMVPAMALSGLVAVVIAGSMSAAAASSLRLEQEVIPYLVLSGFVITGAFALITLGPRYIPAPEVSLIMPLETVLGSYLGWIFLSEKPPILTLIGGFIVILTLSVNAKLSLKDHQKLRVPD